MSHSVVPEYKKRSVPVRGTPDTEKVEMAVSQAKGQQISTPRMSLLAVASDSPLRHLDLVSSLLLITLPWPSQTKSTCEAAFVANGGRLRAESFLQLLPTSALLSLQVTRDTRIYPTFPSLWVLCRP
jgi:hypothetical protein